VNAPVECVPHVPLNVAHVRRGAHLPGGRRVTEILHVVCDVPLAHEPYVPLNIEEEQKHPFRQACKLSGGSTLCHTLPVSTSAGVSRRATVMILTHFLGDCRGTQRVASSTLSMSTRAGVL